MATSTGHRSRQDEEGTRRAALVAALEAAGREHSNAVVMFHTAIAEHLGLNATDHKTLDLLERHGPLSPGKLAQLTGLAPASVTGILDRLEARGFVRRRRDPEDRRRQVVEMLGQRAPEVERLFAGLVADLERVCADYSADELEVILDWTRRITQVQRDAAARLAELPRDRAPAGGAG